MILQASGTPPGFRLRAFPLLFLFLFLAFAEPCVCQDKEQIKLTWDALNLQYKNRAINDTQFLSRGNALLDKYVLSPWMEENTTRFQSVLFSKDRYNYYRSEYFRHLGRNAVVNRNMGKAIFYYEERHKELENEPDFIPTLSATFLNITLMNKMHKTTECIRAIEKVMPFIDSLPQLIYNVKVPFGTLINAHRILMIAISGYDKLKDTEKASRVYDTLDKLHHAALRKKTSYPEDRIALLENDIFFVDYERAKADNDNAAQERFLKARIAHCKAAEQKGYDWAPMQLAQTYMYLAYVFLESNALDSIQVYSQLYKQSMGSGNTPREEDAAMGLLLNELEFKKGNFKNAYQYLSRAQKINDSLKDVQLFEMEANNYAQAESAFIKEQLNLTYRKAETRQRWIAAITIAAILVLLLTVMVVVRTRRLARHKMQLLRADNNLQIAEMENKNSLALFEEQQRLGTQLHDTIAGYLLGIKMFLELQVKRQMPRSVLMDQLEELVADSYNSTRNLSHQWYNGIAENIEVGFLEKLNRVVDKLAPPDRYEREIYVDQAVFSVIPGNFRVQLLHIIQEALYNIVKHAKASRISIRLEETGQEVMLSIRDNGIGFNMQKVKKGVGMESMRERASKILGSMKVDSDQNGTVLTFIF